MAEDKDETLLKEIRDRWDYHTRMWKDVWDEGNMDMKYVSGNPWSDDEKKKRDKYHLPCFVFDELQQHINQTVNEMRVNKLAIKVSPEGGGAKPEHAELRQARIRKIEYDSKAQSAYLRAYEDMISRSYGYFGILTEFSDERGFDQKIKIRMFPNPNSVSIDPDAKQSAGADMMDAFVLDVMPKAKFKRLYPNAEIMDFTQEHMASAPQWISDQNVQVAEYWKVETKTKNLLQAPNGNFYEEELLGLGMKREENSIRTPEGNSLPIINSRSEETKKVKQYMTNGVEILDETDWLGSWIPIFPMFGKELYVESGGSTKRLLLSRVRNARDPFMFYCYVRTTEALLIRMTPKFPYLGVEGQFDTNTDWEHMNDIPTAYAEYKATTDATGQNVLGPPTRQPYDPAIGPLEMVAEAAKRAIQSAFGSYNASIGKEDTHARSGVAIKSLQAQSSQGTYHFVDSDIAALEQAGKCINELLDKIENTPRDVGIIKPDETAHTLRINEAVTGPGGEQQVNSYGEGQFGIVVSTGPSYQTQREEAAQFLDTLVQNLQALPVAPEVKSKLISLAIQLKGLGPLGDEMAKLLDPSQDQIPPQAAAKLNEDQQVIQQMQQQIQGLIQEKAAKMLELESKERIAAAQVEVDKAKIAGDVEIALAKLGSTEAIAELKQDFALVQAQIEQLMNSANSGQGTPPATAQIPGPQAPEQAAPVQ